MTFDKVYTGPSDTFHSSNHQYIFIDAICANKRKGFRLQVKSSPRIDRRCFGEQRGYFLPLFSFDSEWGEVFRTTSRRVCINRHGLLRVFNPVRGGIGIRILKKIFWREVLFTPLLWTCFRKSFSGATDPVEVFIISLFELPILC